MLYPLSYGGSVGLSSPASARIQSESNLSVAAVAAVAIRESPVREGYPSGTPTSYFSTLTARRALGVCGSGNDRPKEPDPGPLTLI
jgi:hypothetical protein